MSEKPEKSKEKDEYMRLIFPNIEIICRKTSGKDTVVGSKDCVVCLEGFYNERGNICGHLKKASHLEIGLHNEAREILNKPSQEKMLGDLQKMIASASQQPQEYKPDLSKGGSGYIG